jgi:hypothetical protein
MFGTEDDVIKMIDVIKNLVELIDKLYLQLAQYVSIDEMEKAGINADIKKIANSAKEYGIELGGTVR